MRKRPPVVAPKDVRPLPKPMWGANCAVCDKPHAKWEYIVYGHREKKRLMCSLCMLYRSKLGLAFEGGVASLIKEVEAETGVEFKKKDGKLINTGDADRIMGAIVFANRVHAIRDVITMASVLARGKDDR